METPPASPNAFAISACSAALGTLIPVLLFQTGAISHLPDPAGSIFDSDRITSSKGAHPLGIPDSLLGMASYSVTLALLLLARERPAARKFLGAKLLLDGSMASVNVVKQVVNFGKICSWCTGTALATAAMVWAGRSAIGETLSTAEALYQQARSGSFERPVDVAEHERV